MEPTKISSSQEFEELIKDGVSLIDFNAPWCGPCRAQEPIIRELSNRFKGQVKIAEMNIDDNQETALKLNINSIPTLTVYKNGIEIQRFVGLQSQNALSESIKNALN